MPIYEYRCCHCGTQFERIQPMNQADDSGPCPQCGGLETKRCLSRFAAVARSDTGETRSLSGNNSCASCSASSCASCKG
jgi:putative FmdB family regulatory protein